MGDRLTHTDDLDGAAIAVVTFSPVGELGPHHHHLGVSFPFLADPDRSLYRHFELGRGALHRVWGPGTLRLYAQLLGRGRRLRIPRHDTRQLGGDFVIGPDRRLVAGFWPDAPDARPPVDALAEAVGRAGGGGGTALG